MSDEETTPAQPAQQQAVQVVQMAQSVTIQPMPEFRPDAKVGASLATRWINWQSDFEMFLTASGITDAKHTVSSWTSCKKNIQTTKDTGNDDDYEVAKAKLKEYFDPQKNRRYKVYRFRQAMQNPDETLDEYHTCTITDNVCDLRIQRRRVRNRTANYYRRNLI